MRTRRKLKILFITEFLPWPLNSGGRIRSYHILRQVAKKHDVTLIAADYDGVEKHFYNIVTKFCIVPSPKKHKLIKWIRMFLSLFNQRPFVHVFSCYNELMSYKINKEITSENYDLIHLDHLDAAIYMTNFEEVKVYLDEHNFETHLVKSLRNSEKNLLLKLYLQNQLKKIQRFEIDVLNRVDAVGVVSAKDAEMIRKFVWGDKISIIPNGVDTEFFKIERAPEPYSLISVGSLDWRPNVDGIIWFLENVWPQIVKEQPKAQFCIVGRNPRKELYKYVRDRVTIAGSVADIRQYVKRATVFVVPLFAGGGTRLKVLEAMAMKIPVVSTLKGAEGIDCENNKNILIANDAPAFSRKILSLFEKPEFAERISSAAFELVTRKYSWMAIGERLESVYQDIVGKDLAY